MAKLVAGSLLSAVTLLSAPVFAAAAPPISAFMNYPRYQQVRMSPGGAYVAMTQRTDDTEIIRVFSYPDLAAITAIGTGSQINVDVLEWASDKRLLIQPARRFPGLRAGHIPTGEIIGVDANGKNQELLFGYLAGEQQTGTRVGRRQATESSAIILGTLPDDPGHVLLESWAWAGDRPRTTVLRMNVNNGNLNTIARGPILEASFVLDAKRQVRFAHGAAENGDQQLYYRDSNQADWQLIATYPLLGGSAMPTGELTSAGEIVVVDDHERDTSSVMAWEPGGKGRRTLFNSPVADISGWSLDPQFQTWVYAYDDHFPSYWYPDPEHPLARMHRGLRAVYKNARVQVTSVTRDLSLAVVMVSAPRLAPTFLVVDVAKLQVRQALRSYPELTEEVLSPTDPVELRARDGMTLRGLLTVPVGASQKNLPLVVLVHGGPHGPYDRYGFDPEVQLLASRGYAVLQVNYRGSGGRGRSFQAAGFGRWGREMQDDITDAVRWAIADGIADRQRICIVGASYGAYAALTGAFREPELFKCAVGISGIYDLPLMYEKGDIQERSAGLNYLREAIGDDVAELRARSPAYNADKIKVPVLLVHGRSDERAPLAHAERMRAALQEAGNEPEWLVESGEGHGFNDEANRNAAYAKVLTFLSRHLGGAGP